MLYLNSNELPLNKGLLDARNTGRTFADLQNQFYAADFFDLCTIIEQIVLRDEIVLVGKYDRLPRPHVQALRPFVDAGVFRICIDAFVVEKEIATNPELRILAQQAVQSKLTSASLQDADYAVTRLLGAEISLRIPTTPLLQHLHNYQFVRRPILDNTVCDLFARYSNLSEQAQRVKVQDFQRVRLKPLPIPPIALYVLQRSHNYEQLREQILQTRDDFRPLRRKMFDLAAMLSDSSLSSAKYYQLVQSWERQWQKLAYVSVPSIMELGTSAASLLEGGRHLAGVIKTGTKIDLVLAGLKLVSAAGSTIGGFTFRPVHLSVRNYIRTHPKQMIVAASRIFASDPLYVRRQMEAVAGSSSNVWRRGLEKS